MSATGACPSCGSPLVFRVATTTTAVCDYCKSIVVREGAQLSAVGKTNEILATGSILKRGLTGKHKGRGFVLVGRTQLRHDLGGTWDEWLVAYDDDKLAWLAEHQGRFALTTEVHVGEAPPIPHPGAVEPGARFFTAIGELIVIERGEATVIAEEGELPERTLIGARRPFVDFSSRDGRVATLDFGTLDPSGVRGPKRFYIGREVVPADLGLEAAELGAPVLEEKHEATTLACPHCGAPVEKKRTESESLVCGFCRSGLSVEDDGTLGFLFAQERLAYTPWIPLGTKAHLDEGFFKMARRIGHVVRAWPTSLDVEVVANVVRSVFIDGERYTFQETLLYAGRDGYFWLVESDGEWLFVRHLPAGLVRDGQWEAKLEGHTFRFDQEVDARVEQVLGELYFRVRAGEVSHLTDFKSAPRVLSKEMTKDELVWSESLEVDRKDVARAFRVSLPEPVYDSGYDGGSLEVPPWIAALVVLAFVVLFLFVMVKTSRGGGGGGGYVGGGRSSGGYSFGK